MLKKFFKPIGSGKATLIVTFFSFLSYAVGLLRDRIIAVNFGTTSLTDAYNASFIIPDVIFNFIIAGALSAAFIPVFSEYLGKDRQEAMKIANIMLTSATLVITIFAIIVGIFAPEIIGKLFTHTTSETQYEIVVMTRIMVVAAIIFGISNTLGSILMSYKHFLSYSLSPIFYNLGIILGIVFFQERFSIYSASYGVLAGAILHCGIRVVDIFKTDYRYKFMLNFKNTAFRKILKLMVPRSLSLLLWQLNLLLFAVVGTEIMAGGWSAFSYARNIQSFAVSLFGIALSTAIFPYLTSAINENNRVLYTEQIEKTIRNILFFTIPAMVGILFLSKEIIALILGGGVFNNYSILITSQILFFFAFSIPFESLSHIFARSFYAVKDTFTSLCINAIAMIFTAAITIFIAPKYGIQWLSIAFASGFILYTIISIILLKKHFQKFNLKQLMVSLTKVAIASAFMGLIIQLSKPLENFMDAKLATVLIIGLAIVSYFLIAYLLKSPELNALKFLRKNLQKQ